MALCLASTVVALYLESTAVVLCLASAAVALRLASTAVALCLASLYSNGTVPGESVQ